MAINFPLHIALAMTQTFLLNVYIVLYLLVSLDFP